MIHIQNISKSYNAGAVKALVDVSLDVKRGEVFGLIGPDGAGKTSLFRILTTLITPDLGQAIIDGFNVINQYKEIRKRVGYMPGRFSLYQDLTVRENLEFYATVFGTTIEANYDRIKPIYGQIEAFANRRAGALSGGMKQKLALSCALVHQPNVLLLDEPTTGVDPVSRKEFWDMLASLRSTGLTILVSTPYMDEASRCDRIALINAGCILKMGTPHQITSLAEARLFAVRATRMYQLLRAIRAFAGTVSCFAFGESHHVQLKPHVAPEALYHYLMEANFEDISIIAIAPSIEDVFMELLLQQENNL